MSEIRDTHFQGFAKLLWDEISHNLRFLDFGFSPEQQASIDNHIREVIAQRAYDLAFHLLQDGDPIDLDTSGNYGKPDDEDVHRRIANLPDLTAWPTPPEP